MNKTLWIVVLAAATLGAQPRQTPQQPVRLAAPAPPVTEARPPAATAGNEGEFLAFSAYQVGPEDLLSVTVMDAPEFSRQFRVSAAGTIRIPLVKQPIEAAGKTCQQLEADIAQALIDDGLLRDPAVSVTLREFHSKPVSVSGAVRGATVFQAARPLRLTEALSRAGGLTESAGGEVLVFVPARDGQPASSVRVALKTLLESPDAEANLWLRGGEDVRVPQAGRVYVLGSVSRPGALLVSHDEPLTLLRALALSGGTTPTASSKAFLMKSSAASPAKREIALNIKKLLKREQPDLPLESDDVLFVPESGTKKISQGSVVQAMQALIYTSVGVLLWR